MIQLQADGYQKVCCPPLLVIGVWWPPQCPWTRKVRLVCKCAQDVALQSNIQSGLYQQDWVSWDTFPTKRDPVPVWRWWFGSYFVLCWNDCTLVCLLVACLTSQQQASVSQGRICSDKFTCCHTEIEAADQTFYLTQSQYTDTGPTSPSADPITPGAFQGSHWSAKF